jgi:hypothetical protein
MGKKGKRHEKRNQKNQAAAVDVRRPWDPLDEQTRRSIGIYAFTVPSDDFSLVNVLPVFHASLCNSFLTSLKAIGVGTEMINFGLRKQRNGKVFEKLVLVAECQKRDCSSSCSSFPPGVAEALRDPTVQKDLGRELESATHGEPCRSVPFCHWVSYPVGDSCACCGRTRADMKQDGGKLRRCSRCFDQAVHYCSRRCQELDWEQHKAVCAMLAATRDE